MPNFKENHCLKRLNTFGINVKAKYFVEFNSLSELTNIINSDIYKKNKTFLLGGGSNILLTKNFNGLILHNKITGIYMLEENEECATIEVGSGVNWHEFVQWSINKKLSGIENLALIPGTVGASPVQNIGAYGMEVKDTITKVHTFEIKTNNTKTFNNNECEFEYRNSIFKDKLKNKIIITKVEFKLFKNPLNKTSYGAIKEELKTENADEAPEDLTSFLSSPLAEYYLKSPSKTIADEDTLILDGRFLLSTPLETTPTSELWLGLDRLTSSTVLVEILESHYLATAGYVIFVEELKAIQTSRMLGATEYWDINLRQHFLVKKPHRGRSLKECLNSDSFFNMRQSLYRLLDVVENFHHEGWLHGSHSCSMNPFL